MTREDRRRQLEEAWDLEESRTPYEYACEQLRHAIEHFNLKEYVPAITLAGAAEEVLGKLAKRQTGQSAIERTWQWHVKVFKLVGHSPEPSLKDVRDARNWIRNELKHNDSGQNPTVHRRYGKAASDLIDAALLNIILIEGFAPPRDAIIGKYHAESPVWEGAIPQRTI